MGRVFVVGVGMTKVSLTCTFRTRPAIVNEEVLEEARTRKFMVKVQRSSRRICKLFLYSRLIGFYLRGVSCSFMCFILMISLWRIHLRTCCSWFYSGLLVLQSSMIVIYYFHFTEILQRLLWNNPKLKLFYIRRWYRRTSLELLPFA